MKQVLSIQDLSCMGKCSLTVALPVLSAMGHSCAVLPTAVLSTHTAFPAPHVRDLTEDMEKITDHWQSVNAKFDAITVGYLADPKQAAAVSTIIDQFGCPVILDPVMGDNGNAYSRITEDHITAMRQLCGKATVLIPNVTEACLLTGTEYIADGNPAYYLQLIRKLNALCPHVVLTGISVHSGGIGFMTDSCFLYQTEKLAKHYHGTGDLFAAVFTGALLRGAEMDHAALEAANFVECSIAATGEPTPFGLNFETQLYRLTAK